MKLKSIFLAGLIALGFAACNNEDVPQVDATNASMSIKITQATSGVRTTGDANTVTNEGKIKKLEVFVFNGDVRDGYGVATHADDVKEVKDIAVTAGNRTIIVVANASETLGSITSKSALLAIAAEDLVNETTGNLLMTSEETDPVAIAAGKNYYGYAANTAGTGETEHSTGDPIQLTRVAAKVNLVGASVAFEAGTAYENWTFTPTDVFLYNAPKESKYFGATLFKASNMLSGVDLDPFSGTFKPTNYPTDGSWVAGYLKDAVTDLSAITASAPRYYYTFENDGALGTVLTIKGTLKDGTTNLTAADVPGVIDADGFTYYSVIVNGNRPGYTYTGATTSKDQKIVRNTQYNLTVTIKHLGKDDPTDPPTETAKLDVLVEVLPWIVVDQAVEY